jgi:hypothetical protein
MAMDDGDGLFKVYERKFFQKTSFILQQEEF